MKIGVDIRCLADGQRTGVQEYTIQLLENIFIRDRENTYVLFLNTYKKIKVDLRWVEKYPNVSIRYFHWPNKILNFCFWYFHWPRVDVMLGGVDMFFMPNLNFIAVSPKVKLYVTAHDLSFEYYPETFSWRRRLWHSFVNFRSICRRAYHIFAISESTKNDLMRLYGIPEKKISKILNGVSSKFQVMSRNDGKLIEMRQKYDLPYKFILYLGTIEPRKNVASIVRAFNLLQTEGDDELKKCSLVIAGVKGWKYEEIFDEIERSPFKNKIILTDFITDDEKLMLYNLASVFVYPSLFEGFGLPPVEAMRCGVPVIVSNTSSFSEVIGDAGIMIDPFQPQEIWYALREVLSSKYMQDTLIQRGLSRTSELNWQKMAQEVLKRWKK